METVGFLVVGIGVVVVAWLFWGLILFPNGCKKAKAHKPASTVIYEAPKQQPQNTEAMDRLWFFDVKTKALVDKARNELPLLYSKLQVLQQKLVGAKVDSSREEGTMMQNNLGGWAGLIVTGISASNLAKNQEHEQSIEKQIGKLQKQIDEDEAIVQRYDNLAVKFARG